MFGIGMFEMIIILAFALIFIGPKKLPELAKGLGKGLREFQKAKDDIMNHVNDPEYAASQSRDQEHIKIHDEEALEVSATSTNTQVKQSSEKESGKV